MSRWWSQRGSSDRYQSSTVGAVVEGKVVEETPLNGRNVMNLIALAPGVVPQGSASGSVQSNQHGGTFSNPAGWGNYQIGGGMSGQSAMWVNGQPLNGTQNNSPVIVPAQDIVQEFQVQSNTVSPEYGRFAGGVVIMTTKQGSNNWHGTAYEYLRNNVLNANDFFNNRTDQPRPEWTQNQFGAALGGPIKKDKAFFFASYEGFRLRLGDPNPNIEIPTSAEMGGDFSALLIGAADSHTEDQCGNEIYNPPSPNSPITGSIYDPALHFGPTGTLRTPASLPVTRSRAIASIPPAPTSSTTTTRRITGRQLPVRVEGTTSGQATAPRVATTTRLPAVLTTI